MRVFMRSVDVWGTGEKPGMCREETGEKLFLIERYLLFLASH